MTSPFTSRPCPYQKRKWRLRITALATMALFAFMTSSGKAALVGYWQLDGNAADVSGLGNNGSVQNGAGFSANVAPQIGSGLSLSTDGNDDRVSIPANPSLNSSAFTLSYWVNQDGNNQSGLFERVTSRGGDTFETAVGSDGRLRYFNGAWNDTGVTIPSNGWTHVAWVNDTAMTLYVDGTAVFTGGADAANSGTMNIGARHNAIEGFQGLIDDVALYNNAISSLEVQQLADGTAANELVAPVNTTVVSNTTDWQLSTVSTPGGGTAPWSGAATEPVVPGAGTFTLTPVVLTNAVGSFPGLSSAATQYGMGTQAIQADNGVRYYRTTFQLEAFEDIAAQIDLAVDNGAAIFINGVEVARETDFAVATFSSPFQSLEILQDGTILADGFNTTAGNFNGFVTGLNEIILAVRNPSTENNPAGGFAFKMQVQTTPAIVPEPTTAGLGLLGGGALGWRRRRAA